MEQRRETADFENFRMALQSICDCYGEEAMKPIPLFKRSRVQAGERSGAAAGEEPLAS